MFENDYRHAAGSEHTSCGELQFELTPDLYRTEFGINLPSFQPSN